MKSVNVFKSYVDAGQDLPQKDREKYYTALIEYLAYGKEPQLKGTAKAVFVAIMPSLKISRQNAENGKKGGNKRKQTVSDTVSEPASERPSELKANGQAISNSNSIEVVEDTPIEYLHTASCKRTAKRTSELATYPSTAPCPTCGTECPHTGGGIYSCKTCDEFGISFKAASC